MKCKRTLVINALIKTQLGLVDKKKSKISKYIWSENNKFN